MCTSRLHRRRLPASALVLSLALIAWVCEPAAASVDIGPTQIVVSDDSGARAVIERSPFRMSFQDAGGKTVLQEVENPLLPGGEVNVDPEGIGTDNVPETAQYAPLAFQVGAQRDTQHPGGLWTGNMIAGAEAGVVHGATQVLSAVPEGDGVRMQVASTDPLRPIDLLVTPDTGTSLRVQASAPGAAAFLDSFTSVPGEGFHGFGGRHNAIDQRGNDFYNWIEEEAFGAGPIGPVFNNVPGTGGDRYLFPGGPTQAYYVQNIFISDQPYGFLLNDTEVSRWRMAADRPDRWQVDVRGDSIDYTVAVGDGASAIGSITAISGRHRVSPDWAMGPMVKRAVQQGNSDPETQMRLITEDIADMQKFGVELDGYAYESWDTLDPEFVAQTNAKLKSMGIRPVGYVRAYVNDDGNFDPDGTFQDAVSRGLVAETPGGAPFLSVAIGPAALLDFTNPDTIAWWEKNKIRKMLDLGFDGFMQDFGEQVIEDMRFDDGSSGVEMHNRYPIIFHRVTREILDRYEAEHPERGPLWMYTRSGFSGRQGSAASESSNFPGDETADWQRAIGLPSLASDMLNRAVGGSYGFTTDIGGYFDSFADDVLDDELFSRWSEWSALSPHFRLHNSCCDNGTQMPWDFTPETLERWKKQSALHVEARPLIRTLWRDAQSSGVPMTRPLWLAYPDDPEARRQDQQWMLGEDVLVAPVVTKGATSQRVYFPTGCWRHGETRELFEGAGYRDFEAPLGRLPWFLRCGVDSLAEAATRASASGIARNKPRVRLTISCKRRGLRARLRGPDTRLVRRVAFRGERGKRARDATRPYRRTLARMRFRGRRWTVKAGVRMRDGRLVRLRRKRAACARKAIARRQPRFTG